MGPPAFPDQGHKEAVKESQEVQLTEQSLHTGQLARVSAPCMEVSVISNLAPSLGLGIRVRVFVCMGGA